MKCIYVYRWILRTVILFNYFSKRTWWTCAIYLLSLLFQIFFIDTSLLDHALAYRDGLSYGMNLYNFFCNPVIYTYIRTMSRRNVVFHVSFFFSLHFRRRRDVITSSSTKYDDFSIASKAHSWPLSVSRLTGEMRFLVSFT